MSHVINIMLSTQLEDDRISISLRKFIDKYDLKKVDQYCGGNKNVEVDLFLAAHKHVSVGDVVADFNEMV